MDDTKLEEVYQKLLIQRPELKDFDPAVVKAKIASRVEQRKTNNSTVPETPAYKPDWDMQRDTRRDESLAKAKAAQGEIDNDWKTDAEAGFLGTLQGLSGDIMPTIKGAFSASPMGRVQRKVNEFAGVEDSPYSPGPSVDTGQGLWEDTKAQYLRDRDSLLNKDRELQQRPLYHAGHASGELSQVLIPGGAGAKGVGVGKIAATSGLAGGIQNALSDTTTKEGEFKDLPQLAEEFAIGGATGAALGGTLGYLGSKVAKARTPAPPKPPPTTSLAEEVGGALENGVEKTVGKKLKSWGEAKRLEGQPKPPEVSTEQFGPRPPEQTQHALGEAVKLIDEDGLRFKKNEGLRNSTPDDISAYNSGEKYKQAEFGDEQFGPIEEPVGEMLGPKEVPFYDFFRTENAKLKQARIDADAARVKEGLPPLQYDSNYKDAPDVSGEPKFDSSGFDEFTQSPSSDVKSVSMRPPKKPVSPDAVTVPSKTAPAKALDGTTKAGGNAKANIRRDDSFSKVSEKVPEKKVEGTKTGLYGEDARLYSSDSRPGERTKNINSPPDNIETKVPPDNLKTKEGLVLKPSQMRDEIDTPIEPVKKIGRDERPSLKMDFEEPQEVPNVPAKKTKESVDEIIARLKKKSDDDRFNVEKELDDMIAKDEAATPPTPPVKKKSISDLSEEEVSKLGPKTGVENPTVNELKNLAQFRNEFRAESKGMNPDDVVSAFTPDKRTAVAEAGMEIGKFGDKVVKELGGEVNAARFLLDEGHAQSVDDLVKMLGMKGQGARADAKNIAKELGYPDLPTHAEGGSKARKKSVADKAKADKKKK